MIQDLADPPAHTAPGPWSGHFELRRMPRRIEDRVSWRSLLQRQKPVIERWACADFMKGMWVLGLHGEDFPDLAPLSHRLRAATGWELVPVHGSLNLVSLFAHLAARRFPVRSSILEARHGDGQPGADLFRHLFGHVPMLAHPVFADYLQLLGQEARAAGDAGLPLYWQHYERTVERGLLRTPRGLRMYGAMLLCEASGELLPRASSMTDPCDPVTAMCQAVPGSFATQGGGSIDIASCAITDTYAQLITLLPRATAGQPPGEWANAWITYADGPPRRGLR